MVLTLLISKDPHNADSVLMDPLTCQFGSYGTLSELQTCKGPFRTPSRNGESRAIPLEEGAPLLVWLNGQSNHTP